jgi:hypothetical protein
MAIETRPASSPLVITLSRVLRMRRLPANSAVFGPLQWLRHTRNILSGYKWLVGLGPEGMMAAALNAHNFLVVWLCCMSKHDEW